MIPKVIHYCWFGNGDKPELVKLCIDSWKRFCPDYEIKEWNESNYDVTKNQYMYKAYQAKRWGFVSDYARFDIIYDYGGFYLDTDVELVKSLDTLCELQGYIGFEIPCDSEGKYKVNSGQGFGGEKGNSIIKAMRDEYDRERFINEDGSHNLLPSPYYNTKSLLRFGFREDNATQSINGFTAFASEYFCPFNWINKKGKITENTYSIHHFNTSWLSDKEKKQRRRATLRDNIIHIPNRILKAILGDEKYEHLKLKVKR